MVAINGNHLCSGSGNRVNLLDVSKKESKTGKRYTHKWYGVCGVCGRNVGVHQDKARYLQLSIHGNVAAPDQAYNDAHLVLSRLHKAPIGSPDGVVVPICEILSTSDAMGDFRNKPANWAKYWEMAGDVTLDPLERHIEADRMRYRDELRYNAFKRAIKQVARFLRINIDFDAELNQWRVLNGDQEILEAFLRAVSDMQHDMDGHPNRFLANKNASQRTYLSWEELRGAIEDDAVQAIINRHTKRVETKERLRQLTTVK